MICKICNGKSQYVFKAKILNAYDISYYQCGNCGFLQTEEPYWINEAYKSPINFYDTGIVSRNLHRAGIASAIIYFIFNRKAVFLDYAGGYGIFTRIMRDIGYDFKWHDPYAQNLFARGFEYVGKTDSVELVTSFESFEHFCDPLNEIRKMLDISKNIMFTTEILPEPVPLPSEWWYYGLEHGQHIAFYTRRTIEYIAQKHKLHLYSMGGVFLLSDRIFSPIVFKIMAFLGTTGLIAHINRMLKSRTVSDMKSLIDREPRVKI